MKTIQRQTAMNKTARIWTLVVLGLLLLLPASWAAVTVDTYERPKAFEPQAQMSVNQRAVDLTLVTEPGPPCARGMTEQVEVLVVQESTGAMAMGIWTTACGVETVAPRVTVHAVQGGAVFEAGAATASAFREARQHGQVVETSQWSREVMLVEQNE